MRWSEVETAAGSYNWIPLDDAVDYCTAHGKKCGIMVNAGRSSPSWLWSVPFSVAQYTIKDTLFFAGEITPDITSSITYPVYLDRWRTFVQALGARYDNNDTVSFIIPTGIAFDDQWLMGGVAPSYLDTAALGNTTAKVNAWKTYAKQVIDFYAAAFPRTTIAALPREPFGPTAPENPLTTMKAVSDIAAATYGCQWSYGFAPLTKDTTAGNTPAANEMFLHWPSNPTHCETDVVAPAGAQGVTQVTGEMDAAVALKVRCMELYRAEMERGGVGGDMESTITSHRTTILAIPSCPVTIAAPTPPSIIQIAP